MSKELDKIKDKWAARFARVAKAMRYAAILAAAMCFIPTIWLSKSDQWNTWLTAAGTLLGVISVWLTLEIFRIGEMFSKQQEKLIKEVHKTTIASARSNHFQDLRSRYEFAKSKNPDNPNDPSVTHWHFTWRFETYSQLSLILTNPNGNATIKILGINNAALETDYEKMNAPIYTVDILNVQDDDVTDAADRLLVGRAYCWCANGTLQISNNANEIELQPPFRSFLIASLGPTRSASGSRPPKAYRRLRDLEDPTLHEEVL